MRVRRLTHSDPDYPRRLAERLTAVFETVLAIGNISLLRERALALFCSVKCPGRVILRTYDLVCSLRDKGVTVIGGFQSPMEKEGLTFLLRGTGPIIVCPARNIERMRLPKDWRAPLTEGRLLLLSPFDGGQCRTTVRLAEQRNRFVAALASKVFVAYASPGGKTEQLCHEIVSWGKPLLTFDDPETENLLALGATLMTVEGLIR